jgi:hypothetical protein
MSFKNVNAGFVSRNKNTNHFEGVTELKSFIFNTELVSTVTPVSLTLLNTDKPVYDKELLKVEMANSSVFYVDMTIEEFYTFLV